jgi:hypothetical protein
MENNATSKVLLMAFGQVAKYEKVKNFMHRGFSDKLMMFHKIDMFSMKIRSYANAASLNGRHDLGAMYSKFLLEIGLYVQDGAKIFIDEDWMEKPPQAVDRNSMSSNK